MDDEWWKIAKGVSFWAMSAFVAGGCTAQRYTIPDSFRASSQAEAGTLLVSPTMVAPWDEVAAALKPAFVLTGDQAAAQVLPTTESISEQVLSSFGASLAAGLPTTATTSKTTIGGANPGTTTTIDKAPGTAPTISNPLPSSASLPAGSATSGALGLDPGLKYEAANYLLQKVQLLNQEIDNAAARSCYVPYVVKLKLATMNYRPRLPYSVHAHIGFNYNGALSSETRAVVNSAGLTEASNELAPECRLFGANPAVIPFLAADDVQIALHSRAAEAASQIAVGLSALVHGVGLAANAGAINESLTAISNHQFTSSLTVGRESESSLYVLITPNNQSSNQAALASQTYDVAVLVLIPRYYFGGAFDPQSPIISVATFSEYRDASTGEILTDGGRSMLIQQGERIIVPHLTPEGLTAWNSLTPDEKYDEAKRLADTIKQGSMAAGLMLRLECKGEKSASAFCQKLHSKPGFVTTYPAALWADFASLLDYDSEKLALFEARLPTPIAVPSQQVILSDDGTKPLQALLGGVSGRSMAKVTAFLNVTPFDVKAWERRPTLKISAQTLTFDGSAHTLALSFPSLKKLNITCLSPAEIPPRPPSPPKAIQKAPSNSGSPAAKPELPDCPQDSAKTAAEEPNRIVLSLTGCDATREVCPLLTDTELSEGDYVRLKGSELARWQSWVDKDVKAKVDGAQARLDILNYLAEEWHTVAKAQRDAVAALKKNPKADPDSIKQNFYGARSAAYDTARSFGLEGYLDEPATLSVYLAPPPPAPDAPTVTFSNFGPVIDIEKGAGQLVLTIAATPASDTVGISVKGASLKSVTDSTDTAIPFSAKHGFVLPQTGVYTLNLTDMKEKVPVVLSGQALKGDASDGAAVTQIFETTSSSTKTTPAKGVNPTQ